MVCLQFVGNAPHSRGDIKRTLFEEQTEPIGVEDSIYYQTSYSLGFKYFHIKLGLKSSIEYQHQYVMNI